MTGGRDTLRVVHRPTQAPEPLYEIRLWLPESILVWLEAEAEKRSLRRSAFLRSHLATVKDRQDKANAA